MTNLEAKQEAIKNAYGEYWENVKDYVDNDGWINNSIPKFTFGQLKNLDLEYKNDVFFRPKSLQGIENNTGWIKIESEADLPKESWAYWIFRNDNLITTLRDYVADKDYLKDEINITHYQPIEKPLKPLY